MRAGNLIKLKKNKMNKIMKEQVLESILGKLLGYFGKIRKIEMSGMPLEFLSLFSPESLHVLSMLVYHER